VTFFLKLISLIGNETITTCFTLLHIWHKSFIKNWGSWRLGASAYYDAASYVIHFSAHWSYINNEKADLPILIFLHQTASKLLMLCSRSCLTQNGIRKKNLAWYTQFITNRISGTYSRMKQNITLIILLCTRVVSAVQYYSCRNHVTCCRSKFLNLWVELQTG
jgi:hypothetical protein